MKNKVFGFPGGDFSKKDFDEAMKGLIEKGLAVSVGDKFELTDLAEIVHQHLTSDSTMRN